MFRHHGRHWSRVTRYCIFHRTFALLAATVAFAVWASAKPPLPETPTPEAAESAARKFDQIREAHDSGGSFGTVRLSEHEANSYLAYELDGSIPTGVSDIVLQFTPGRISGSSVMDFDKLKEGLRVPFNPIADFLLRGVHTVGVQGSSSGINGTGQFHLDRVLLDGVELPQMVVDYMIEQYLKPRYPSAAINQPFLLPFSIDSFRPGTESLTLTGKAAP
jgi:hypothetical protein